jgi:hypothetical protein
VREYGRGNSSERKGLTQHQHQQHPQELSANLSSVHSNYSDSKIYADSASKNFNINTSDEQNQYRYNDYNNSVQQGQQ